MKISYKLLLTAAASLLLASCGASTSTSSGSSSSQAAASSQEVVKIGILQYMEHESLDAARQGFMDQLKEDGYVEGKNLQIDLQNAQGEQANLQTIAEQLVGSSDLVLAIATPAAQALAMASSETPVVFTAVTDPVSADLVQSMEAPGGLLTGTSDKAPLDKQVGLLQELYPDLKKVGVLYTLSERNSEVQVEEAKALFEKAGIEVVLKGVNTTNDVQDAATSLMEDVEAIWVPTDNTVASTMSLLGQLSIEKQVPIIGGSGEMVAAGGLFTYGTNYEKLGRQTALLAEKILQGQDLADVASELPNMLDLYVNEEVAAALGLDLSKLSAQN